VSELGDRVVIHLNGVAADVPLRAIRVEGSGGGGCVAGDAEKFYQRGMQLLVSGKWLEAAGALGQAARFGSVPAMWAMGVLEERRGKVGGGGVVAKGS
jgi:hypothetical protein